MDDRLAYVALGCLMEPGNRALGERVTALGPVDALHSLLAGDVSAEVSGAAVARLREHDPSNVAKVAIAHARRLGARLVTPADDEWPGQLGDLVRISQPNAPRIDRDTFPPLCLWVRGTSVPLNEAMQRAVSVVGARASTPYGEHVTSDLAYGLADRGWTVVSGGAYGIDTAAHRGAMAADGLTVAVLACGVDRPYPASNTGLFERIADQGLLISEWPPGTAPHKHRFLIRNRVIAALARGTVVVEASARSGALQTLRRARALDRSATAVPGPVTSAMSVGCHMLLREEGVRLVTGWADVLEEVGSIGADLAPLPRGPENDWDSLDPTSAQVLDAVPHRGGASAEHVAAVAGVSIREALRSLGLLRLRGFVVDRDGSYCLARR
ncbi:MAG TPA: DNA-processing protein DprA [Micromonosporaceae bacterium]|nr:DNA-processing protein DprA [Micromonosporaceae bacterium]